jgi:hypothetical protein
LGEGVPAMSTIATLVQRVIELSEECHTATIAPEQRALIERRIVAEFGGDRVYVQKRIRPLSPTWVGGAPSLPVAQTVRTIQRQYSVSRATGYRWVRG